MSLSKFTPGRADPPVRTALVHYWLVGMRGGEKVLEQLCQLFPSADIFTHVYVPEAVSETIRSHRVQTTFIQAMPYSRKMYKKYLSFMPSALEQLDLSAYDLVISSEAGPAKGVITRPDAMHICYCHSPMRYIWDQYAQYYKSASRVTKAGMRAFGPALREWDVVSAARVDHFVANSTAVSRRIEKFWRRTSEIIAPPVDTVAFRPGGARSDYYLYVGEFVPYKRADLAVDACTQLGRKLVVIGDGPLNNTLRRKAGPSVTFLGKVSKQELAHHYASCRALLFPAEEDFGIVPVEALASGAPVLAFERGGARDYILPDENGLYFPEQSVPSLIDALLRFEGCEHTFDPQAVSASARAFDTSEFIRHMQNAILSKLMRREDQAIWARTLAHGWNMPPGVVEALGPAQQRWAAAERWVTPMLPRAAPTS